MKPSLTSVIQRRQKHTACRICICPPVFPACNVLYINSVDMESLTGPQAVAKAISQTLASDPLPTATTVHFKVSSQGITLTDSQRKWVHTHMLYTHTDSLTQPHTLYAHCRNCRFSMAENRCWMPCYYHVRIFFRRHYPISTVTYCDIDPQNRKYV